jgi:hypothetical protein
VHTQHSIQINKLLRIVGSKIPSIPQTLGLKMRAGAGETTKAPAHRRIHRRETSANIAGSWALSLSSLSRAQT